MSSEPPPGPPMTLGNMRLGVCKQTPACSERGYHREP
jgi:hypothetical protein